MKYIILLEFCIVLFGGQTQQGSELTLGSVFRESTFLRDTQK